MAIETREKKIGECVFSVTQLPARRSLRLKTKLLKLFGATVVQLFSSMEDESQNVVYESEDADIKAYFEHERLKRESNVKVMQLLAVNLDEKIMDDLVLEILQGVRKDGVELTPALIDHTFAGDLMTLYQVILFVLEVNYADFFALGGIGSLSSQLNPPQADTKKTYKYK